MTTSTASITSKSSQVLGCYLEFSPNQHPYCFANPLFYWGVRGVRGVVWSVANTRNLLGCWGVTPPFRGGSNNTRNTPPNKMGDQQSKVAAREVA